MSSSSSPSSSSYKCIVSGICSSPIIKNVDCTYVLTMSDSKRRPDFDFITQLCQVTIVQINKGFRICFKEGVYSVESDITHAYKNVCVHALESGFSNILILEDDVRFISDCRADLQEIDKFIADNVFSIYSLGSAAFTLPISLRHHLVASPHLGGFHAIIWNVTAMLAVKHQVNLKRIDSEIAISFPFKYMYYKPIAKQLFPNTESRKKWAGKFQNAFFKTTNLAKNLEPGWSIICFSNYLYSIIGSLTLLHYAIKYEEKVRCKLFDLIYD